MQAMTWYQGWRPKQLTLTKLACNVTADDARLGDFSKLRGLVWRLK